MEIIKNLTIINLLFLSCFLSGCSEDADSEDIRTSGIYASMDIEVTSETKSNIEVHLKVGGSGSNTYLNLTSGDTLIATLNDSMSVTLSKEKDFLDNDLISYKGSFSGDSAGAENSVINIAFNRPDDDSAPNSSVTLPAPITGLSTSVSSFDRSTDNVSLSWDSINPSNSLELEVAGDCIFDKTINVADNGTYTINAGTLESNNIDPDPPENCTVAFYLKRAANGTLDTAFGEGGYIRAKQIRKLQATSTP